MKPVKKPSKVKGKLKKLERMPTKGMPYKQYRDMLGKQLVEGKISHKRRNELLAKFRADNGMPRMSVSNIRERD